MAGWSLRPLWQIADIATGKPTAVVWGNELQSLGLYGVAQGWHPQHKRWTITLNPYALTDDYGIPNRIFANVFFHECWHVRQGHPSWDGYIPPAQLLTLKTAGKLRTTADIDASNESRRREAMADEFARLAAERWTTAWLWDYIRQHG